MPVRNFIEFALHDSAGVWSPDNVARLADLDVPQKVLGRRRSLLKGDINEQWARWFAESLADPRRIAQSKITYPFLFGEVFKAVEEKFHSEKTRPEKQEIASMTARIILHLSDAFEKNRKRRSITLDERRLLLDIAGEKPRCWICGVAFRAEAIDNFLDGSSTPIELPPFVDVFKPRGLAQRDLAIEIDHVLPFSKGGQEEANLTLACGWCNRYKSAYTSIYDVEGQPRTAGKNSLGITSLPQPFWVVRLLAVVRNCEHPNGCSCSVQDTEMTVIPINERGALNPTNLRVVCYEHDPLGSRRLQPPGIVKTLWKTQ